jgi:ubiquinone/menaquinone biosynthesis C-methylase UbiE
MSTSDRVDTTYEPFSREPEYVEGNRAFVKLLPLGSARTVLDVACGTGTISKLMLEENPRLTIFGLDLSRESLLLGREDYVGDGFAPAGFSLVRDEGGLARLVLVEGSADRLPFRDGWADLVFMGHSIHNLPDLEGLLDGIRRVMKKGATFHFNSSFYAGSQAPGTDPFYQHWWKGAMRWIMDKDRELRRVGRPGIERVRGTAGKAFSYRWRSREEWSAALEGHGFEVTRAAERTIMMSPSAFETVGSYSGLAAVMVSGYPAGVASQALRSAVRPAFAAVGETEIPRLWLEMSAVAL